MDTSKVLWPGWETGPIIGHGAFAKVYSISREIMGVREYAALKVISIPKDPAELEAIYSSHATKAEMTQMYLENRNNILREYAMLAEMKGCSHIVYADDFRSEQHPDMIGWDIYIKMEQLTPLHKIKNLHLTESLVTKLGIDICSALAFCAKRKVIHRDIKPANIFVASDGSFKLGDFGIAKSVESVSRAVQASRAGTDGYMAPEVFYNQPYDASVDVYSLGLVLYEMLNDYRRPFEPPAPQQLTTTSRSEALNRRLRGEKIPEPAHGSLALKLIVLKACAFNPKDRFANADEMLSALRNPVAFLRSITNEDPPRKKDPYKPVIMLLAGVAIAAAIILILLFILQSNNSEPGNTDDAPKHTQTEDTDSSESQEYTIPFSVGPSSTGQPSEETTPPTEKPKNIEYYSDGRIKTLYEYINGQRVDWIYCYDENEIFMYRKRLIEGINLKWSSEYIPNTSITYHVLEETAYNCIGFTFDFNITNVPRGTGRGDRTLLIENEYGNWEKLLVFAYPEYKTVTLTVELDHPTTIIGIGTTKNQPSSNNIYSTTGVLRDIWVVDYNYQ